MPMLLTPQAACAHAAKTHRARAWPLWIISLSLAILAAPPRLINLGALSYYADEDLTALAARSVAAGFPAQMPTGMPYRRALPYTWLTALSGEWLGGPEELAYRLPAALLGILFVPVFFLLGRRLTDMRIAGVAALMLALSEWHLVYSRQARMYSPFLLCFLIASVLLLEWTRTARRRDLLGAVCGFVTAVSLHALALFALVPAIAGVLLPGPRRAPVPRVLATLCGLGLAAVAFDRLLVATPYAEWLAELPRLGDRRGGGAGGLGAGFALLGPLAWIGATAGAAAGFEAMRRAESPDRAEGAWLRRGARLGGGTLGGLLLGIGQLYGAMLVGTAVLLIHPVARREIVQRARTPLLVLFVSVLGWCLAAPALWGARGALRWYVGFPFPYGALLAIQFVGVALLAAASIVWLAARPPTASDRGHRIAALSLLVALMALGAVSRWDGTRYLLFAYPFLLLLASMALLAAVDRFARRWSRQSTELSVVTAAILVASGVLGGHGVPQAVHMTVLRHGERVDANLHGWAFRPDHRGVGEALRRQLRSDDFIIAEDPTEVYLYAGRVDYWLRRRADARRYLYRDAQGALRDFYVGSALAETPGVLDAVVGAATGRVWLVTSGETYAQRSWYLTPEQTAWLRGVEERLTPLAIGEDGKSRLYCITCQGRVR